MEKKNYSTRGAIFELSSSMRVFAFMKCEFIDIAFHKCEVSVPEKMRNALEKSKKGNRKLADLECEVSTSHFSNARYSI